MLDIKSYIQDKYTYELVHAEYQQIPGADETDEYSLRVHDEVQADVKQDTLCVLFTRKISFEPKGLSEIRVQYKVNLRFAEGVSPDEVRAINWAEEIRNMRAPFLTDVISRASWILSSITAVSGQAPIITPPTIIN